MASTKRCKQLEIDFYAGAPDWLIRPPNYDGDPRGGFLIRAWTEAEARALFGDEVEHIELDTFWDE